MHASFFSAFVAGEARATGLLPASFRDSRRRVEQVRAAGARRAAPEVIACLRRAEPQLAASGARRDGLEALAAPGTVAVVTGQQMGLFLGPLFTLYKAATAVRLAAALQAESGVRCVPLFWLQTEDHDFPEINHCHVPGARLEVAAPDGDDARLPVAHRRLGDDIDAQRVTLAAALDSLPHAAEVMALLDAHYRPGRPLGGAFAGVLAALFADEGLLVLDPRQPELAARAAPLYRRALVDAVAIAELLQARTHAIEAAGFDAQVHVRDGSPLFFFHPQGAAGPRYRLQRRGDRWGLVAGPGEWSEEQLLQTLAREPLCFSSSALLRPLVEDTLLPTVAYVAGPSELQYLAQLTPLYSHLDIPQPMAVPRARLRCVEESARALCDKLQLRPADAERPREELLRTVAAPPGFPAPDELRQQLLSELTARLDALEPRLPALDVNLLEPLRKTRDTAAQAVGRLVERYRRSLQARDQVACDRVDRLQRLLFPDGTPQERHYSFPYFAARYGIRAFKECVLSAIDPFDPAIRDVDL